MAFSRTVLALFVACTLGALSACSDSTDSPSDEAEASAEPTAATSRDIGKASDCRAKVRLTGDVKAAWKGKAVVTKGGDTRGAEYFSEHDGVSLTILRGSDGMKPLPIVTADGTTYSVQDPKKGIKIDPKGGGATVKSEAVVFQDGETSTVKIDATFTC